ncbi:MAG: SMC-Scp complex subunit ScpB [Methanobacteriota archaeon]|nr:MAG: SMC-Scp complex subunit ScpB [Euryarchaeota archaeon]
MTDERGIVEAALFSAGRPVSVEDLAKSTRIDVESVKGHVKALAADYTTRHSAVEIAAVGGKWTMQIRREFADRAQAFAPPEIDRDLLKTVTLIAYHQPVLQSDLGDMIGSKVYEHVQALVDLSLVNKRPSGRSFELTTTRYFVEFFGLKATDREGIRRLLAEQAGVKFTPKPAAVSGPAGPTPEGAVPAGDPGGGGNDSSQDRPGQPITDG